MSLSCFVVYRAVVTTLLIGWPLADLLTEARRFYGDQYTLWFLFATNWSLLLLVLTAVVLTLAAALHLWRTRKHSGRGRYLLLLLLLLLLLCKSCFKAHQII